MNSIFERVQSIIEKMGVSRSQITPNAHFSFDLGFDSLDQTDLVIQLESEFRVRISDEEAQRLVTVAQAVAFLEEKVRAEPVGNTSRSPRTHSANPA